MRCSFIESKQSQALVSFAFRSFHHPKDMVSPLFMDFFLIKSRFARDKTIWCNLNIVTSLITRWGQNKLCNGCPDRFLRARRVHHVVIRKRSGHVRLLSNRALNNWKCQLLNFVLFRPWLCIHPRIYSIVIVGLALAGMRKLRRGWQLE